MFIVLCSDGYVEVCQEYAEAVVAADENSKDREVEAVVIDSDNNCVVYTAQ